MSKPVGGRRAGSAAAASKVDIAVNLRTFFTSEKFSPGSLLPSEAELMVQLGCSRYAIRQALGTLRAGGLIQTRSGKGSYLSQAASGYVQRRSCADPAMELKPISPPAYIVEPASFVTAELFGIPESAAVFVRTQRHRHRATGDRVLTVRTLPYEVLPGVERNPRGGGGRAVVLGALVWRHGELTARDRWRYIAVPGAEIGRSLGMPLDERRPVMEIRRMHFTPNNRLLMVESEYIEAGAVEWEVEH